MGARGKRPGEPRRITLVTYAALVERGIFNNRMTLRRAISKYGFPEPYHLGPHRVAWDESEVEDWLRKCRSTDRS